MARLTIIVFLYVIFRPRNIADNIVWLKSNNIFKNDQSMCPRSILMIYLASVVVFNFVVPQLASRASAWPWMVTRSWRLLAA